MNNLLLSLEILFKEIDPEKILNCIENNKEKLSKLENEKEFLKYTYKINNYSLDEKKNLYNLLKSSYINNKSIKNKSIFNLLLFFSENVLKEVNGEPVCIYEHLLEWSEICRKLGEEIFTTSYFAYIDIINNYQNRCFFSWKPIISSDNLRLKEILKKGLAENHSHLKATSQNFQISWIYLMNNITKANGFNLIKERLYPNISFDIFENKQHIKLLVKKASYIRAFLFSNVIIRISSTNNKLHKNYLFNDLINIYSREIQKEIDTFKYLFGYRFSTSNKGEVADYLISKNISNDNFNGNILLYGERFFMYSIFKEIFKSPNYYKYQELFYSYLVIKNKLRNEFIQLNDEIGLKNFQKYEKRKDIFIPENSIYEKFMYYMALKTSIKNQNIKSFETRFTPKNNKKELAKKISFYDNCSEIKVFEKKDYDRFIKFFEDINKNKKNIEKKYTHFYTLHFIKEKDKLNKSDFDTITYPRHHRLRENLKTQVFSLINLRKSLFSQANRIYGIDAASSEIGNRPEIFSHAYRFLKGTVNYNFIDEIRVSYPPNIGYTFHVGEDFLDITDGLRAIDEAIKFLNLERGDRIGHALALGLDTKDYYNLKNRTLLLPKHDILDNIVWLLAQIRKFSINSASNLAYSLEKEYNRLFLEIYENYIKQGNQTPHHSIYYKAWKLRGDSPYKYNYTIWDEYSKNKKYPKFRYSEKVSILYEFYHYDFKVRKNGAEIEEFIVNDSYINTVNFVQKAMQDIIKTKGIGIESNPTSNYLISTFKSYSKHPIIKWFNIGLETDINKIKESKQLFVSINTDDQGIFNTYLENEYALMALALEKEIDKEGNFLYNPSMIYDWIDRIRQMGLEQSFKK